MGQSKDEKFLTYCVQRKKHIKPWSFSHTATMSTTECRRGILIGVILGEVLIQE